MAKENTANPAEAQDQGTGVTPQTPPTGGAKEDEPQTPSNDDKAEISVTSEGRKGKTIFAVSGKPIVFDNEGKAKVGKADAEYLKNCPGFSFK